jgi:hypothetical protein
VTYDAPLKLLNVLSREITYDTVGKDYFTVSHVWTSNYFSGVPFSADNKGYPWLKRMSALLKIQHAWIDTCCIDQNSVDEKQREIGNMREYYANASACAVILSSTNAGDIDTFAEDIKLLAHDATNNPYRRLGHVWALASILRSNLLTDEWFGRVWTIQEIVLSHKVVVESSNGLVDLAELLRCYYILVMSLGRIAMCSDEMNQVRTLSHYIHDKVKSYDIAAVLELCVGRQATNKHDYVYGVLGLLPSIQVEINYNLSLETVMTSFFREAVKNKDLSWISWIGPSSLERHSYIPTIGSRLTIDKWDTTFLDGLSVAFDANMTIASHKMDVEIVGVADWEGSYPGLTNACAVLYVLCVDEKLCHSCLVTKLCARGCCTPYMIQTIMMTSGINYKFCTSCSNSSDIWSDGCSKHMEMLFAKQHDRFTLLMKAQNKYLIGRTDCETRFDDTNNHVLMFGEQENGYRGWIMDGDRRIGIVSYHDKDLMFETPKRYPNA